MVLQIYWYVRWARAPTYLWSDRAWIITSDYIFLVSSCWTITSLTIILLVVTVLDLFGHSAPKKVNLWGRIKEIVLLQQLVFETHKLVCSTPQYAGRHYTIVSYQHISRYYAVDRVNERNISVTSAIFGCGQPANSVTSQQRKQPFESSTDRHRTFPITFGPLLRDRWRGHSPYIVPVK
jgi:hypothetical protein